MLKKRKSINYVLLLFLFICLVSCANQKTKNNDTQKNVIESSNPKTRILVVFSTDKDNPWSKQVNVGIKTYLVNKGYEIEEYYLNIDPLSDQDYKEEAGKQAIVKFNQYKPGIVLAVDDPAQMFFARNLIGRSDVDIVFCGVEGEPSVYNYPHVNVTGILKRPQVKRAMILLEQMDPAISTYTVLTDKSEESNIFIRYIKGMNLQVEMELLQVDNMKDWMNAINTLKSDVVILYNYRNIADAEGSSEVLNWTLKNVSIPSVAFSEYEIQKGILLGIIESGYEQGSVAAQNVNRIIDGKKANQVVTSMGRDGFVFLNKTTAEKLDLDYSMLEIDKVLE